LRIFLNKTHPAALQNAFDFVLNRLALASKEGWCKREQSFAQQTQNYTLSTLEGVNVWHWNAPPKIDLRRKGQKAYSSETSRKIGK